MVKICVPLGGHNCAIMICIKIIFPLCTCLNCIASLKSVHQINEGWVAEARPVKQSMMEVRTDVRTTDKGKIICPSPLHGGEKGQL